MNIAYKAAAAVGLINHPEKEQEFNQHLKDHQIEYGTQQEYQLRYKVWENKDKQMKEHNNKEQASFKLGHNKFSTWTEEEMNKQQEKQKNHNGNKGKHHGHKKHQSHRGRGLFQVEEPQFIYKPEGTVGIDWRKKGVETKVIETTQCGDPFVFQAVDELQMAHQVRTGTPIQLSMQQMIDCYAGTDKCDDWHPTEDPYAYIVGMGLATETAYPYVGTRQVCKPDIAQMEKVNILKVNYIDQYNDHPIHSQQLERVIEIEPVTVKVDASSIWFQGYAGGILDTTDCGQDAHHPMIAVGWSIEEGTGRQYYILKNSWGEQWGEKGYVKIAATFGGWGVCGVQTSGVFPETT